MKKIIITGSHGRVGSGITAALKKDLGFEEGEKVVVPAGKYLRFEKTGNMPETALLLWQEVWGYFQEKDAPKRNYLCDFEELMCDNQGNMRPDICREQSLSHLVSWINGLVNSIEKSLWLSTEQRADAAGLPRRCWPEMVLKRFTIFLEE